MSADLLRTSLHGEHARLGAKLVPFAGFEMPVQYPAGITAEHRAVRERAGMFDASHMGELIVGGPDALALVQRITVNDAARLAIGQAQYSAMCRKDGGILDDLVVYRMADRFMLVVNASRRERDLAWALDASRDLDVSVVDRSAATALIAVQGPASRAILARLSDLDPGEVGYYQFREGSIAGVRAIVSGTGYTGEDGVELYLDHEKAPEVWRALLDVGSPEGLVPSGLAARDSLRLEMGYALYGNDLDEGHTPLEAGLAWLTKLEKGDFIGRDALLAQKEGGVERRLVGMVLEERGFPRAGYDIRSSGDVVGAVTSGTLSPSLGQGIALGYVPARLADPGTELELDIRGKGVAATVVRTPFYTQGSLSRK